MSLFCVLRRAELAGQYLVVAQARVIAHRLGLADPARCACALIDPHSASGSHGDEPPSLAELRARLLALRCLAQNLPQRGMRLLRRIMARQMPEGAALWTGGEALAAMRRLVRYPAVDQCAPHAPWHPPKRTDIVRVAF